METKLDYKLYKILLSLMLFIVGIFARNHEIISFGLFLTSYIIIGYDVLLEALDNIVHGEFFDETFLMTIATIGAFLIKEFPEACAVMLFFQIGEYLQDRAVEKSKNMITSLASMKSDTAIKIENDTETIVATNEIRVGDIILVRPGEKIPLDSDIIEGKSTIDTKAITGESIPRSVQNHDHVLSGCLNLSGVLTLKVTDDITTSTVTKILSLLESANENKTTTENFITKFAKIYTPFVVIAALLICLVPLFIGGSFQSWIYRALVFLTISCPCALVISIPLGFVSGLGVSSKYGVLFKGTNHLETLSKIDTVVFDKTGTLTEGTFKIQKINTTKLCDSSELLNLVAHAEYYSNHPIAHAIKESFPQEIKKKDLKDYKEIAGKGISVLYKEKLLLVGNESLMKDENIKVKRLNDTGSILYITYDNQFMGTIIVSDKIRVEAKEMVTKLKNNKIEIVILSGDHEENVKQVATELGISHYYANLLPHEKVEKLKELKQKGKVMFIGDGMNDAPVMLYADLAASMGEIGSDSAIETSDVILMNDNLTSIVTAMNISKKTKQVVYQNIIFSIVIKLLVLLLGAFGIASIWHAVFADVGVTILAILYSFTIYFYHYDK